MTSEHPLLARLPPSAMPVLARLARWYWFLRRPRTTGVKVAITTDSNVLLVRHTYDGRWNLPGGGFAAHLESPEAAARREIAEELGIELMNLRAIGTFTSTREFKRDTIYCFSASCAGPP